MYTIMSKYTLHTPHFTPHTLILCVLEHTSKIIPVAFLKLTCKILPLA